MVRARGPSWPEPAAGDRASRAGGGLASTRAPRRWVNCAGNAWTLGQGRRISSSQRSRAGVIDWLAARFASRLIATVSIVLPLRGLHSAGGMRKSQSSRLLLVARIQQGVSHQFIENRLERGSSCVAIDLEQDRLPVLGFLTRLDRRVTGRGRSLRSGRDHGSRR